jgi:hypothetical protein
MKRGVTVHPPFGVWEGGGVRHPPFGVWEGGGSDTHRLGFGKGGGVTTHNPSDQVWTRGLDGGGRGGAQLVG